MPLIFKLKGKSWEAETYRLKKPKTIL